MLIKSDYCSLLQVARGARNPNLNIATEHAQHVCSLMLAWFVWTSTKNEWNEKHAIW